MVGPVLGFDRLAHPAVLGTNSCLPANSLVFNSVVGLTLGKVYERTA
jgi:hypothetical protein